MNDSDLAVGEKYLISTFEDTQTGYSQPREAKIVAIKDAVNSMGSKSRIYYTIDIDGAEGVLTASDFIKRVEVW